MANIGLFFGSFNPIHNGHVAIAESALINGFDEVWFIISRQNPFKPPYEVSDEDRLIMVSNSCKSSMIPYFKELSKDLSGRTWDTLEYIKQHDLRSNDTIHIICGDDTYFSISKWYKGVEILRNYSFYVFRRIYGNYNDLLLKLSEEVGFTVEHPINCCINCFNKISSTKIRELIKKDVDYIQDYVPNLVYKYIKENNLYVDNTKT